MDSAAWECGISHLVGDTIFAKPWIPSESLQSYDNNKPCFNFCVQRLPCGSAKPICPCQTNYRKLRSQGLFASVVIAIQEKSAGGKMFCKSEIYSGYVSLKLIFLIL